MSEDIKWVPISGNEYNLFEYSYGYVCKHNRDKFCVTIEPFEVRGTTTICTRKNDEIIFFSKEIPIGAEDTQKSIASRHMRYVQEKYIYSSEVYNLKTKNEEGLIHSPSFEVKCEKAQHNPLFLLSLDGLKEYVLYADGKVLTTPLGFHVRHIRRELLECIANEFKHFKGKSALYDLLCAHYDVVSLGQGVSANEIKVYVQDELENLDDCEKVKFYELNSNWIGPNTKDICKEIKNAFEGLSMSQKAVVEYILQSESCASSFIEAFLLASHKLSPTQFAIATSGVSNYDELDNAEALSEVKEMANSCLEYMQLSDMAVETFWEAEETLSNAEECLNEKSLENDNEQCNKKNGDQAQLQSDPVETSEGVKKETLKENIAFFDLEGTVIYHNPPYKSIPLMPELLNDLKQNGWRVVIVSSYSKHDIINRLLESKIKWSEEDVFSSVNSSKGAVIKQYLESSRLNNKLYKECIFVDGEPANLESVNTECKDWKDIRIIGFVGSRKCIPEVTDWCYKNRKDLALSPANLQKALGFNGHGCGNLDGLSFKEIAELIPGTVWDELFNYKEKRQYFFKILPYGAISESEPLKEDYDHFYRNIGWVLDREGVWAALSQLVTYSLITSMNLKNIEDLMICCPNNYKSVLEKEFNDALKIVYKGISDLGEGAEACCINHNDIDPNRIAWANSQIPGFIDSCFKKKNVQQSNDSKLSYPKDPHWTKGHPGD